MKKRKKDSDFKKNVVFNIQSIIMSVLMAITLVTIVTMGFLLYQRFKLAIDKMAVSNTEATVESTVDRVNSDLLDIRQIFNAANYNIVQEFDISSEKFAEQFSLLYEVNSDKIESLALYGNEGRLIASEPVAVEKENIDVTGQDWYKNAESAIENVHFSVPHIQNLYEDGLYRYHWVVSLSRYVDINDGEIPGSGVLLVDMKYSVIEDVLKQINDSSEGIYYYMISRDGQMIYHPRKTEMARGLFEENSLKASGYEEGTYEITTDGHKESVVVGNIAYTGWKLIGVVPESVQTARINNFRYYIFTTIMVLMMMLLEGNRLISRKISKPIRKLDESVKTYEAGGKTDIYIGGSSEIRHLGYSVQRSYERIETLMEEIIRQQNERRKSELDALQSQINPHFLYNTLESITWMIEAQKNEEAVIMISELAKLLRVSLSRGKTIIPVKDELRHSRSYMNIQLMRYKERFQMEFQTDKEIEDYCIVKLVIQPILENAIYYGVGNMDEDDEGKITVRGEKKEDDIYIIIEDNGMGMRKEVLENILKDNNKVPKHGSGVGVINVHSRIQLMFGEQYGLEIYSEPDEGTRVVIHIPAIPYTKEIFLILTLFFAWKIFDRDVPEKRVAVILPESGDNRWNSLIKGMKQSAKINNLHMIICNTDEIENAEMEKEIIKEQKHNNIDAFIICPAPGSDTKDMLKKQCAKTPYTLIMEDVYSKEGGNSGNPVIGPDYYKMGSELGKQLGEKRQKIGVVTNWKESKSDQDAIRGLKDSLKDSKSEIDWYCYRKKDQNIYEKVSKKDKVDAIVVLDPHALEELGEQSDEDSYQGADIYGIGSSVKAVVLLDNGNIQGLVVPDAYEIGYKSVGEMAQRLEHRFYRLKGHKTEIKVFDRDEFSLNDNLERFLYSYE